MDSRFSRTTFGRREAKEQQGFITEAPNFNSDEAPPVPAKVPLEDTLEDRMISNTGAEAEAVYQEFMSNQAALLVELRDELDQRLERIQQTANDANIEAKALHRRIQEEEEVAMARHHAE